MRSNELQQLAEALRAANPVHDVASLVDSEDAAQVQVLVRHGMRDTEPVSTPEIPVPITERRPSRSRPAWAFGMGLAVIVAAVGLVVMLGGDSAEVAKQRGVPVGPSSLPDVWSRVPADDAVFAGEGVQRMYGVTAGGPGLVAVGTDSGGGDMDAAVWTSPDGITWTRVPHDQELFGGDGRQFITSVIVGGPGLVAVGADGSGADSDAAVWTSTDGITWTRVPHDEAAFGGVGNQQMDSVTVGGPGLVAVGYDKSPEQAGWPELVADAAVWTSPDGIIWTRVPHDEYVFGHRGPPEFWEGPQFMNSVTAGGPGLVAVGAAMTLGDSVLNAAVWTSPDGITWTRIAHDAEAFGGTDDWTMTGVTAGGPGLVAVGWVGPRRPSRDGAVWTSPDGIEWTRIDDDEDVLGGEGAQMMTGVTATEWGLVAVGTDKSGGDLDAAVWTSPDGITWTRILHDEAVFGGPDEQTIEAITVGGPGLVAVGVDAPARDMNAAVWMATSTAKPSFDSTTAR